MNTLDLAIIAVIALSAIFSFARGLVREALSIAAWVGAAAITLYAFSNVYTMILRVVTTPLLAELIAGAGLFIISLIVLTVLTGYLARFVDGSALSPINRTLGLIFGLARGVFLVCLAYLATDISLPQNDRPSWLREAKSERFLAKGAEILRDALPDSLQLRTAGGSDDTRRPLDRAQDAQRAMRALATPSAPGPAQPGQSPSYKSGDRRDLDRLIESTK